VLTSGDTVVSDATVVAVVTVVIVVIVVTVMKDVTGDSGDSDDSGDSSGCVTVLTSGDTLVTVVTRQCWQWWLSNSDYLLNRPIFLRLRNRFHQIRQRNSMEFPYQFLYSINSKENLYRMS
jgi:hypothetical protein